MNRNKFLKTSTIGAIGLGILPQISWMIRNPEFSRDQLIGKSPMADIGESFSMHPQAYEGFKKLKEAAANDGLNIEMVSAYRSFQRQKEIFEGKYQRFTKSGLEPLKAIEKIIEYSTIPGTSRHHWGTDIDIIDGGAKPRPQSVLQAQHFHGKGPFCKLKEWLNVNAEPNGFIEVYTDNANRKGFKYEPWHFSYAPVSVPMLSAYKKLNVKEILQEEKIMGSEHFTDAFIEKYRNENILDVNPKLLS